MGAATHRLQRPIVYTVWANKLHPFTRGKITGGAKDGPFDSGDSPGFDSSLKIETTILGHSRNYHHRKYE